MSFSFPKYQRLTSQKIISDLFKKSRNVKSFPLQAKFIFKSEDTESLKILVVVPKKKIANAVHRNFLKRRIKESVRQRKGILISLLKEKNMHMDIAFVWTHHEKLSYAEIDSSVFLIMLKVKSQIEANR